MKGGEMRVDAELNNKMTRVLERLSNDKEGRLTFLAFFDVVAENFSLSVPNWLLLFASGKLGAYRRQEDDTDIDNRLPLFDEEGALVFHCPAKEVPGTLARPLSYALLKTGLIPNWKALTKAQARGSDYYYDVHSNTLFLAPWKIDNAELGGFLCEALGDHLAKLAYADKQADFAPLLGCLIAAALPLLEDANRKKSKQIEAFWEKQIKEKSGADILKTLEDIRQTVAPVVLQLRRYTVEEKK